MNQFHFSILIAYLRTCVPAYLRTCVPAYLRTCVPAYLLLFFVNALNGQVPPPNIELLPVGLETNRFNLGILHNNTDDFSDFLGTNTTGNLDLQCALGGLDVPISGQSYNLFPINSNFQTNLAPYLKQWLGLHNLYRHGARSDEFSRAPYCLSTTTSYSEYYYNHALLSGGACNDITFTGQNHLTNTISSAQNIGMQYGVYRKSGVDFFYETTHGTADLPENNDVECSDCLCRKKEALNVNAQIFVPLSELGDPDGGNFKLYSATGNSSCPSAHFLCVNCTEWTTTSLGRLHILGEHHPDFVMFDEWPMPEAYDFKSENKNTRGCWCKNCREKHCGTTAGSCFNQFINFGLPNNTWIRRRAMVDFMDESIREFFENSKNALNQHNVIYVQSVQNLTALNDDNMRTSILKHMDVAKTEWSKATRSPNNEIFWGDTPTEGSNAEYYSVLHKYRIPPFLRLATAISTVRDGTPTRSVLTWSKEIFSDLGCVAGNNVMLHTLGLSYTIGSHNSISFQRPLETSINSNTVSFNGIMDEARFLTNNVGLPSGNQDLACVGNIRLFDYDHFIGGHLAYLRNTPYAGIYFSERERNRYLYLENNPDQATLGVLNNLAGTTQVPYKEAQREALAWLQNLLPLHAAYQSLSNGRDPSDFNRTFKLPVTMLNDDQIQSSRVFGNQGIVIPLPADVPPQPLTYSLAQQLLDPVTAQKVFINLPVVGVGNNDFQWFNNNPTPTTNVFEDQANVRNMVVQELGLPPIYATGHSQEAIEVEVGFHSDPNILNRPWAVVVLSNQPAWGLMQAWLNLDPVYHLPTELQEESSFPTPLPTLGDDIVIRVPLNSVLLQNAGTYLPCAHVVSIDGSILISQTSQSPILLPLSLQSNTELGGQPIGEYTFSVPSFTHTCVIKVNLQCQQN